MNAREEEEGSSICGGVVVGASKFDIADGEGRSSWGMDSAFEAASEASNFLRRL